MASLMDEPDGQLRSKIIRRSAEFAFGTEFNGETTIGREKGLPAKGPITAPRSSSVER